MPKKLRTQLKQELSEDAICEKHLETMQLFCADDQVTLCEKCFISQEHKHHTVYTIQEAAKYYRRSFQKKLNKVEEKLEVVKNILTGEKERMIMIQEEEQNFEEMIESENKMVFQLTFEIYQMNFLNQQSNQTLGESCTYPLTLFDKELEKSQEILQKLHNWAKENMDKLEKNEVRLSKQLHRLQQIRAELKKKCGEPSVVMLQNARHFLERGESLVYQSVDFKCTTDLNFIQITGLSKLLKEFQRPITLDPKTAHHYLTLSKDLKSVKLRNVQQDGPDNSRRLDFSCTVLGMERFTSGKHYWEVDVEKATKWQLGLYEEPPHSSSEDDTHKASGKKFLLTRSMFGISCTFWVFPPLKKVSLTGQMNKIGIFLYYESGYISFYDATHGCFIYAFSNLTFHGAIRPFFSLCISNGDTGSDSLGICFSQDSACNVAVNPPSSLV
ncbi:probable E3 ubiquitin-protein ligase TRIML2 [Erinaceus europaeus]|uniref:Probable E3 ubiquitin-protein ligase TRIML2 n=1 Tax=Erinaceus europaeus TaxID=9365 RepID=A0A1S3W458_ERIEU|nr:probable E3 ubiquitin-protein ligase TRIML2 [Erinaceus europaeus]